MENVFDTLKNRGFIKQTVYEDELYALLGSESVPFYVGFDPTADSLHVGHFLVLMAMAHMQRAGHKPVVLLGGGTAMIGDPSGRTDMRTIMTKETIAKNVECFKRQMSRFFDFEGENAAIMVNNADWLLGLNYIDFLRDIGPYFSVNKMITAECFRSRMEKGLSFLEFNYMLMQGYDFLVLYRKYGCKLQCGGDDQWSNMLGGANLIRRKDGGNAFAMTFSLLLTSEGKKMGKTMKGALWLDRNKTSPYEFYQYFRNVDDADVENCLKFLTFVPLEEIAALTEFKDERINRAKERLAYEVTKIVHGAEDADRAAQEARSAFGGDGDMMPEAAIPAGTRNIIDILLALKFAASKGDAKRLIDGGGVKIDDQKISEYTYSVPDALAATGYIVYKGKKTRVKVKPE